jgi:hypothetical protein
VVVVARLQLGDPPVGPVAQPQHDRGQRRGEQRPDEDGELDVVVAVGAGAEGELADEQRDREADAREQGETEHVGPGEAAVELGAGEPRKDPRGSEDPDDLAHDESEDHADGDGVAHRGPEAAAENRHPCGEEGEDRHGDAGRDRPHPVLEPVRHVGPAVEVADGGHGGAGLHGDDEAEEDAGHRGVDARPVHERPRREGQRQEQPPVGDAVLDQRCEHAQRDHGRQERQRLEVGGEDDGDDRDRDEVVDHRQGEQERPQRRGQR